MYIYIYMCTYVEGVEPPAVHLQNPARDVVEEVPWRFFVRICVET